MFDELRRLIWLATHPRRVDRTIRAAYHLILSTPACEEDQGTNMAMARLAELAWGGRRGVGPLDEPIPDDDLRRGEAGADRTWACQAPDDCPF